MTTNSPLQIDAVRTPSFGGSMPLDGEPAPDLDGLAAAKEIRPSLLVPGYLPDGVALSSVSSQGGKVFLSYTTEDGQRTLSIDQGGTIKPGGVEVKSGQSERIAVAGADRAYIVRGAWVTGFNSSGEVIRPTHWDVDIVIYLLFMEQGELIIISGEPGSSWSASELVRIAESLRPY